MVTRVQNRRRLILPMLLPGLFLFALFFIYPIVDTVRLSFTDWNGISDAAYVGFDNYKRLWSDDLFRQTLNNIAKYSILGMAVTFPTAIALAWALRQNIRGERVFQYVVFMPVVLSVAMVAILWKFIYHPSVGLINQGLRGVGLDSLARPWLGDPDTVIAAVAIAIVWHSMGVWVILVGSGMDSIPKTYLEAARIDGANEFQILVRVIVPLMWNLMRVLVIYYIISWLKVFAFIYIMTEGGPFGSSDVPAHYTYNVAFGWQRSELGYATALGVVIGLIVMLVAGVGTKLLAGKRYAS